MWYSITIEEPHALGVQPLTVAFGEEHSGGAGGKAISNPARNAAPLMLPIGPSFQPARV